MRVLSFTRAVLRHLADDPGMYQTCREWMQAESDPGQRVLKFAALLAEDVGAALRLGVGVEGPEAALHNAVIDLACERVNWRRVAAALLKHFTQPYRLACPVADPEHPPRWTGWEPAAWNSSLN